MENKNTQQPANAAQQKSQHSLLGDVILLAAIVVGVVLVGAVIVAVVRKIMEVLAIAVAALIVLLILPFIRVHIWL